jgi:ribosomal protein L13E
VRELGTEGQTVAEVDPVSSALRGFLVEDLPDAGLTVGAIDAMLLGLVASCRRRREKDAARALYRRFTLRIADGYAAEAALESAAEQAALPA